MLEAHFHHLSYVVCTQILKAKSSVRVAVCWFSHQEIFHALLSLLQKGVKIDLILEYDSQNIREEGLDFQTFIQKGGQFWASRAAGLMHHKFAIVDDHLLLSGSFNWTYNSNAENLLVSNDPSLCTAFRSEFERLKSCSERIFHINRAHVKVFDSYPLFENTEFQLAELRKKISSGVNIWVYHIAPFLDQTDVFFNNQKLLFDEKGLLRSYWAAYRIWDKTLFDAETEKLASFLPDKAVRALRRWAIRLKIGDLILAIHYNKKLKINMLCAMGILQSDPGPHTTSPHSSYRSVQWLKVMVSTPLPFYQPVPNAPFSKFKGSGLRLLHEVFGEEK